jgi:hypothetical protein
MAEADGSFQLVETLTSARSSEPDTRHVHSQGIPRFKAMRTSSGIG